MPLKPRQPAFHVALSRIPQRPGAHRRVDSVKQPYQTTRPLAVLVIEQVELTLAGRDQRRQHHARLVVAIPVAIDALDATERILVLYVILNRVLVLFGSPEILSGTHL